MKTNVTTFAKIFAKSAFTRLVERLYAENAKTIGNQGTLASVIGTCFASMSQVQNTWKRDTFRDLLLHLEAQGCYALLRDEVAINALANIAAFGNKLVRDVKTWERDTLETETQMSSLIKHCFANYEVPTYMESVFYYENKIQMLWYVQLGRGESVLNLSAFPVKFTKKMAHEFKNAPANYNVSRAIRWAQAKGFGASEDMAETLAWSALSEGFEHEDFWSTVIRFFAKYETLPYGEVQDALFYISKQFEANKAFSMKGRTWEALLKQTEEWTKEYYKKMAALNRVDWKTSGISELRKTVVTETGIAEIYIIELTNSEALYDEGYEMSHCVAEYETDCAEGTSAIFSLRKRVDTVIEILATIEVALEYKAVVQAKAKYNESISLEAENIVLEWAQKEKLNLEYEEYYAGEHQVHVPPFPQVANANAEQVGINRTVNSDIDWKWIIYIGLMLLKACVAVAS